MNFQNRKAGAICQKIACAASILLHRSGIQSRITTHCQSEGLSSSFKALNQMT
ncbi:D-tyrosyl-tRNA deacylase [Gimesia maris DSM 8797]|nr:D-tyrosyl-tRNA deacylase [Gimesia maris DSM 8797]